ncbi:hypothetical protein SEA_LADYBIRD_76 [Mycobacterium phage LadyBird]|uniref:hypothetical protein n=1 Tax=Mycobacterium phage LadyBird TaxID=1718166 RepID=UPI0006CE3623|nr:hypothetical protein SEA_LADYBIRD_76 [Mycobacterium phage LadyBird]ALF02217.1 hypothetical protein SEA_LADYBIRD_76 [Mycobacterium phage LadyBird]QNJ57020.1 hypothetical protein SEA_BENGIVUITTON_72 [Mycobacterium phage BengiVuitton]UXE04065.1 hypothetical protein SEA_DELORIS_72 [Mycobacterium phage Deloris]
MKEYRKALDLESEGSTFVELGPIEGMPPWHQQAQPSRWPFPSKVAAERFAAGERERHPGREVNVR